MKVKLLNNGGFSSLGSELFPVTVNSRIHRRNRLVANVTAEELKSVGFVNASGSPYPFSLLTECEVFKCKSLKITLLNDGNYSGFEHVKFPVQVYADIIKGEAVVSEARLASIGVLRNELVFTNDCGIEFKIN